MTYGGTTYGGATFGGAGEEGGGGIQDVFGAVPASGWHALITHPTSGRRIRPEVLDSPAFVPGPNTQPEIRLPVRKSPDWLASGLDDDPALAVWKDGDRLPIDELTNVTGEQGRTVLVGRGGVELDQRVRTEFSSEERHVAARDLVSNTTTYATDVDDPTFQTLTDQTQQDPTTTSEFESDLEFVNTDPVDTSGDELTIHQTSFTTECENFNNATNPAPVSNTDYSDGSGIAVGGTTPQSYEWDFTTGYDIPADDFEVGLRLKGDGTTSANVTWTLDGTQISEYAPSTTGIIWEETIIAVSSGSNLSGDIAAGSHTLRVEVDDTNGDIVEFDVVQPHDTGDRYSWGPFSYTYDNTVSSNSGWLDGPGTRPAVFYVENAAPTTAFSYTAADISLSIDDTTGDQFVQLSNDRGSTWLPSDGSEENTSSVDVTFADDGTFLDARMGLASFSPSGTRDQTPRENYDAQTVTDYTLDADIELKRLLVDATFDDSLDGILNDIAGSDYQWTVNNDANGQTQVSWTFEGDRTASDDPEFSELSVEKDSKTFPSITCRGSNAAETVSYTASSSFEKLRSGLEDVLPNSETVSDGSGTTFDRGDDYEMNFQAGEIRILSAGDISGGDSLTVEFRRTVTGTWTDSSAGNDPDERVVTVPEAPSDAVCEQIAFRLVEDFKSPRWAGDAVVPRSEILDPLDALPLSDQNLPSGATPLSVARAPEITPAGINLRLGGLPTLEQRLSEISGTVSAVSRRV